MTWDGKNDFTDSQVPNYIQDFKTPPKLTMHRAIFFDASKTKPEFIWVKYWVDEETGAHLFEGLKEILGGGYGISNITANPVRNRELATNKLSDSVSTTSCTIPVLSTNA